MTIIPPLFSLPDNKQTTPLQLDKGKTHFCYFGSFYENVRSPLALLQLLSFLKSKQKEKYQSYQFHIIGQQSAFSLAIFNQFQYLKEDIIFHGFLNKSASYSIIYEMHYLINIGNSTNYHLPSKVVEYLYFNKPLINLISIDQDSSRSFLHSYQDMININPKDLNKVKVSSQLIGFLSKERQQFQADLDSVAPYMPDRICEQYITSISKTQAVF